MAGGIVDGGEVAGSSPVSAKTRYGASFPTWFSPKRSARRGQLTPVVARGRGRPEDSRRWRGGGVVLRWWCELAPNEESPRDHHPRTRCELVVLGTGFFCFGKASRRWSTSSSVMDFAIPAGALYGRGGRAGEREERFGADRAAGGSFYRAGGDLNRRDRRGHRSNGRRPIRLL